MKVLILGGSGFVGSNLRNFLKEFHRVDVTSRSGKDADLNFDVANEKTYSVLKNGYDVIINCIVDYTLPLDMKIRNDVYHKTRFMELVAQQQCHYIDISSLSALNENKGLSDYNFCKYLSDEVTCYIGNKFNLMYTILRYSQIFDFEEKGRTAQKALYYFIDMFRQHKVLNVFGNANAKRSYMPVEILVRSVHKTIADRVTGIHNVIMPDSYSANDLIHEFNRSIKLQEEKISYQPGTPVMEYHIPPCSSAFEQFLSQQPSCLYYFKQLLEK